MVYCHVTAQIDEYTNNMKDEVNMDNLREKARKIALGFLDYDLTLDVVDERITEDHDFLVNYFYESQNDAFEADKMIKKMRFETTLVMLQEQEL